MNIHNMLTLYPAMGYCVPMVINPPELGALEAYKLATSLIVPRPIAWVGSRSKSGVDNLAPFSFFMGVSTQPPSIAISVARGRGGALKDTAVNILATGHFTVSLVSFSHLDAMVTSSLPWPPDVSEFEAVEIPAVAADTVLAPRPAEALATMECRLVHQHDMGSTHLLVGEVSRYHFDPAVIRIDEKGHRVVDLGVLDPIARLGGADYCRIGEVFSAKAQK
jgi:flavin reductase (DIM6/NTAB) family NADH-FMN oxidoreductase RutF